MSRYGVAPDHPEVKNCEDHMINIMKDFGDSESRHKVRFLGNVEVGKDITLKELEDNYNSVVLAYGCTSADNKLSIPGADLPGVVPARQFVNWYNGHPDYYGENKYIPPPLDKVDTVSIIGNGNVALMWPEYYLLIHVNIGLKQIFRWTPNNCWRKAPSNMLE